MIDSQVAALYESDFAQWLSHFPPKSYARFVFPSGESNKNIDFFIQITQFLLANEFSRGLNLIAIGGGVVGDVTGFVAASYLRGVNFIYCPTTLLAQVDAAIGGKTAINLPEGKNLIGAFYPPKEVICDSHFLATLPEREFASGLAEAVKHGLVCSEAYFNWLKENADAILSREPQTLNELVSESIRLKAQIVARDSRDLGCRQWLNFGHTIGHAIESATGYHRYLHGEAVAIGMVAAMRLSEERFGFAASKTEAVIALLTKFGLPVNLAFNLEPVVKIESLVHFLKFDKKQRAGQLNWVLLEKIGRPTLINIALEESVKKLLMMLGAR